MTSKRVRRRRSVAWAIVAIVLALVVVGVFAGVRAITGFTAAPVADECVAPLNGTEHTLDLGQARNAALVTALSVKRSLPAHAATIALATALQESKLRNLSYGHADSVGLFQQRPSQGWGTEKQLQNPAYATNKFYDALTKIKNYRTLPVTEAAQKVQHSAYPEAYAKHEQAARAFASALTGNTPSGINCTMHEVSGDLSGTEKIATVARLKRAVTTELGAGAEHGAVHGSDGKYQARYRATGTTPASRRKQRWNIAAWALASAYSFHVTEISLPGREWKRSSSSDGWVKSGRTSGPTIITVGTESG